MTVCIGPILKNGPRLRSQTIMAGLLTPTALNQFVDSYTLL